MCGRTACTLQPDRVRSACGYVPEAEQKGGGGGKFRKARWVDQPGSKAYHPSYNIAPTGTLPVLIRGQHAGCADDERVVMPMRWGLVPFFHKVADMKLSTFNARSEEFLKKSMFSHPFKKGQRCVVVCDGYYEWKKDGAGKKPYFLYSEQRKDWDICTNVNSLDEDDLWSEAEGWKGPKLTMMAGIFESWKSDGDQPLYSFTILTQAANSRLDWLHSRMPVFLVTPEAVRDWLSVGETSDETALALITPADSLAWHPVSADINNVRNQEVTNKPLDETKRSASAGFMANWLGKAGKRSEGQQAAKPPAEQREQEAKPVNLPAERQEQEAKRPAEPGEPEERDVVQQEQGTKRPVEQQEQEAKRSKQ
ncbi:abasic site processing protein HMCES-like isoform X2 [Pollicipes pollicipes]|uniref:abasic site processing protein HMCES-like isoform X2 n=1 Tax=Pollicipes pollicipes TaxID=41117 RepID=UPI001884CC97|nr:abasic site processing protein HMCES-like isoform X2 [Pollicipes pollicipes]XP_037086244.1 abasic site processing protein HMCES-like isoform X2 [Pollicipes pollicipes]